MGNRKRTLNATWLTEPAAPGPQDSRQEMVIPCRREGRANSRGRALGSKALSELPHGPHCQSSLCIQRTMVSQGGAIGHGMRILECARGITVFSYPQGAIASGIRQRKLRSLQKTAAGIRSGKLLHRQPPDQAAVGYARAEGDRGCGCCPCRRNETPTRLNSPGAPAEHPPQLWPTSRRTWVSSTAESCRSSECAWRPASQPEKYGSSEPTTERRDSACPRPLGPRHQRNLAGLRVHRGVRSAGRRLGRHLIKRMGAFHHETCSTASAPQGSGGPCVVHPALPLRGSDSVSRIELLQAGSIGSARVQAEEAGGVLPEDAGSMDLG